MAELAIYAATTELARMASSSVTSRLSISNNTRGFDDELTCPICLERLDVPKSLNCLHCVCKKCLEGLIERELNRDKTRFECPKCRESHAITKQRADAFKTHFTISNLIEHLVIQESEEKKVIIECNNSNDTNPAVRYCGECECYLCPDCVTKHGEMKVSRNHKTVLISDISADPKKMTQKRYCTEHEEEELKVYCVDTQEVICRDCQLDDTHRDKNHTHKLIKSMIGPMSDELKALMETVAVKHTEFKAHHAYIEQAMIDSVRNTDACNKSIGAFFEAYRRKLDDCERRLKDDIERLKAENRKHMQGEKEAVEVSIAKLTTGIEYTTKLLDSPNAVDTAMMYKQTNTRLVDLGKEHWDRKTVQISQWKFYGNEEDPLLSKIRGGLNRSEIIVTGLGQPILGEKNHFKIQLKEGVEANGNPTVTFTRNGERVRNFTMSKDDGQHQHWTVTYEIIGEGEYEIGVSVDGVEAENSPFKRIWRDKLSKDTIVDRGRDWKWGDQNGGVGNRGTVKGWSGDVGAADNWVKVKWKSGRQNNYRWGAEAGCYDLMILKVPESDFAVEENLEA